MTFFTRYLPGFLSHLLNLLNGLNHLKLCPWTVIAALLLELHQLSVLLHLAKAGLYALAAQKPVMYIH